MNLHLVDLVSITLLSHALSALHIKILTFFFFCNIQIAEEQQGIKLEEMTPQKKKRKTNKQTKSIVSKGKRCTA